MWPFAAVMVAMLFLFIGQVQPHHPRFAPVDWPLVRHGTTQAAAVREDAICISVTRDGSVYFRDMRVLIEELPRAIRQAVRDGAERKVYLAVDARSKYGDTKAVVDKVREAGIHEITFLAERTDTH